MANSSSLEGLLLRVSPGNSETSEGTNDPDDPMKHSEDPSMDLSLDSRKRSFKQVGENIQLPKNCKSKLSNSTKDPPSSSTDENANKLPESLLANKYGAKSTGPFVVLIQPATINHLTSRMNVTRVRRIFLSKFSKNQILDIFSSGKH